MAGPEHSIALQKITLQAPDEKVALALQPALAGINERQFLPVIERVFDEFDRAGSEILIERLDVDLGTVPLGDFATVAAGRLREALRAELARILAGTAPDAVPGTTILDEDAAKIAILEHYLLSGLWPTWAPRPGAFDLDRMVLGIAARQPAELGALLYRIGRNRAVLERLVAQLDEATLERLVEVLEPQHAALIVGTIAESKLAHKAQPVVDMSEEAFADQVWLMTLNYLVAEPGTQFNRREFVKSLLHGMAEKAGARYGDILATLRRALQHVAQRRPLRSSLPAILLELARDEGQEIGAAEISIADGAGAGDFRDARVPPASVAQPAAEFAVLAEVDVEGMAALLADADTVFRRYDSAEALVRLARAGARGVAGAAGMSRMEIVTALLELPSPVVRTAMTQAFAAGQRRPMRRFLSGVPEREIALLLRALLPSAMVPGAPFFESVQSYAAKAVDKPAFYASLMTAILRGESIALDELGGRAAAGLGGAAAKQGAGRRAEAAAALAALHALLQPLPRKLRPRDELLAVILRM
ncbi:MAG: hypothetical protein HY244_12710, partial [Rhizobiales bacterium]|nr:hypothetical protein [Hyphomicrobiales bacterium]